MSWLRLRISYTIQKRSERKGNNIFIIIHFCYTNIWGLSHIIFNDATKGPRQPSVWPTGGANHVQSPTVITNIITLWISVFLLLYIYSHTQTDPGWVDLLPQSRTHINKNKKWTNLQNHQKQVSVSSCWRTETRTAEQTVFTKLTDIISLNRISFHPEFNRKTLDFFTDWSVIYGRNLLINWI